MSELNPQHLRHHLRITPLYRRLSSRCALSPRDNLYLLQTLPLIRRYLLLTAHVYVHIAIILGFRVLPLSFLHRTSTMSLPWRYPKQDKEEAPVRSDMEMDGKEVEKSEKCMSPYKYPV